MKRFLVVAVVAVMMAGAGVQVWAEACTYEGATHCQFGNKGCYDVTTTYSNVSTTCGPQGTNNSNPNVTYPRECTCEELVENCITYGQWYKGASFTSSADNHWGGDIVCSEVGGEPVGEVKTEYGCCNWSTEGSKCFAITDETKVESCKSGTNVYWEANCGDNLPDDSRTCPSGAPDYDGKNAACSGKWCYWDANPETGGAAGCFQIVASATETCETAIQNCESYSPRQQTYSSEAACLAGSGVKLIASAKSTPNLRVSYAKNRVTVNWTPSTKVSSGTVSLINAKGVTLSTAFIKASNGKVSVKLGTVGVPTGMYFIQINATGQDGKKLVSQSAVSIVK
jgi:hypothetical protein